jgi:hypothetical protein
LVFPDRDTPIDDQHCELVLLFLARGRAAPGRDVAENRALIQLIADTTARDVPIWEHKVYRDRPALVPGDGPIVAAAALGAPVPRARPTALIARDCDRARADRAALLSPMDTLAEIATGRLRGAASIAAAWCSAASRTRARPMHERARSARPSRPTPWAGVRRAADEFGRRAAVRAADADRARADRRACEPAVAGLLPSLNVWTPRPSTTRAGP